jgi:hypothetical protein
LQYGGQSVSCRWQAANVRSRLWFGGSKRTRAGNAQRHLVSLVRARGAVLKATEQPIDTGTAAGKCFLDMLGVFAEFETNLRRERQLEGIAKAKLEAPSVAGLIAFGTIDRAEETARLSMSYPPDDLVQRTASLARNRPNNGKPLSEPGIRRSPTVSECTILHRLGSSRWAKHDHG